MSRLSKLFLALILIVFVLACNFVTQPIDDVQNLANTAESFATALPLETLQALPSALPTDLPDFEEFNYFDPQGAPLSEWNGIPIMPQATAGEEHDPTNYSFKASVTAQEASEYYSDQMVALGWSVMINMSGSDTGGLIVLSKDGQTLTITVTSLEGETVVLLTLA